MRTFAFTVVLGTLLLFPRPSAAQQDPAPPTSRLRVETISSRFVVGPDIRFGEVNDRSATMAGLYAGRLTDSTLFVGGGAYWLANRDDDFKVAYGGPIIGLLAHGDRKLAFGARTLIGFGNATLSDTFAAVAAEQIRFGRNIPTLRGRRGFDASNVVAFEDNFFIAEPQINAMWRITNWLGVDAGVGYRLIAGSDLLDDRLRGLSGSVALQFGR